MNKLLAEAQKAEKAKKWDDARALYDRAIKVKPSMKLSVEAAKVEIAASAPRDAAERLIVALAYAKPDLPAADRKAAEDTLALAKSKIGELRFNVKPKGAEILVDGVSLGNAPIDSPVFVDPGAVEVSARLDGLHRRQGPAQRRRRRGRDLRPQPPPRGALGVARRRRRRRPRHLPRRLEAHPDRRRRRQRSPS